MMDRADKQRAWGDANEGKDRTNKTQLKWGHLKHLQVSKEVLTRHQFGKNPQTLSGKSACLSEVPVH